VRAVAVPDSSCEICLVKPKVFTSLEITAPRLMLARSNAMDKEAMGNGAVDHSQIDG